MNDQDWKRAIEAEARAAPDADWAAEARRSTWLFGPLGQLRWTLTWPTLSTLLLLRGFDLFFSSYLLNLHLSVKAELLGPQLLWGSLGVSGVFLAFITLWLTYHAWQGHKLWSLGVVYVSVDLLCQLLFEALHPLSIDNSVWLNWMIHLSLTITTVCCCMALAWLAQGKLKRSTLFS